MPADLPADYFDLCTRPWIPIRSKESSPNVGLRELFLNAHRIDGLAVALPPAASGLMRVLCAMAARITGLHTASSNVDWQDLRYDLLEGVSEGFHPASVDAYLAEHSSRLRLHDPARPFLQDPRLANESPSSSGVNKLVMARPAGNNQVFFGHFTDHEQVAIPSAEAALHLIAQLYYGPSGQCTPRTVSGKRFGNTYAGPLRRALSYHPEGRSLFETLLLGIPAPSTWPQPGQAGIADACPWEREALPHPTEPPAGAVGPLSALTEQYQHAILLQPSPDLKNVVDATITWAFRENHPPHRDPFLIWDEGKDGALRPRDAKAERSLWRDLDALVLMHRGDGGKRPLIVDGLIGGQIPEETSQELRFCAYGFDQDGQTRDRTYFSASTPPLFALLEASDEAEDNALALGVKESRDAAEKAARQLEFALRNAWRSYTTPFTDDKPSAVPGKQRKGGGPWPAMALAAYWPAAEEHFWGSLDSGDFTHAQQSFGRIALQIYDEVTRPVAGTPRGAKAREGARGLVRSLLGRGTGQPRLAAGSKRTTEKTEKERASA